MTIAFMFDQVPQSKADTAVITVYSDCKLSRAAEELDRAHGKVISNFLSKQQKFKGNQGQLLSVTAPQDSDYVRFILIGLGEPAKLDAESCETAGGKLYLALKAAGSETAHFYASEHDDHKDINGKSLAAHLCMGVQLRSYSFDKYKTKKAEDEDEQNTPELESIVVISPAANDCSELFDELECIAQGIFLARDLVNEPPNELYPEHFAKIVKQELAPLGIEIEIIDEKKMQKLGFHAHLAVGMGSSRGPCVAIMRWNGSGSAKKDKDTEGPLAFVGKGVTFDTGGINIKPSAGMEDMKMDMGGGAAVVGLMKSLAMRKSKADVIGIVGLAENMPSHTAYRPSDIIGSLSGKTIEVLNTDAEGRLVLADCLTYIQRTYSPRFVIDLATLTGAIMVALGHEYCGTFVNDDKLWSQLEKASKTSSEKLWRMPLDKTFKKDMVSPIADLRSLGGSGRYGGACTAAGFLEHFIEDDRPWAHLDIAGTAWVKSDKPTCPKPGTGFGVRVLDRLVAENYE